MPRKREDEGLLVRFFRQRELNAVRSELTGKPEFDESECISINVPGSRDNHVALITDEYRERFKDEYREWKANEGRPITGMPLEEWPLATTSFVEEMKMIGVRTVEELAGLSDPVVASSNVLVTMRARAQGMLDGASSAEAAQVMIDENQAMKARIAELEAQLAAKPAKGKATADPVIKDPASMSDEELEAATKP